MLNASNASNKSEEFILKVIEVLIDKKEQNWFKRAHVGKFLGIENIRTPLNDFGVMYVIVNSRKDKGKALKEHILKDIVPRRFDARIEEIQEKHGQAIEEKDAAIVLLNDDLKNCKYDNVALQEQKDVYKDQLQKCQDIITHLRTHYVDHAKDPGKDNIVMIIEKNTAPGEDEFYEYPYYIARIQRWFINTDDGLKHNIHIIDL